MTSSRTLDRMGEGSVEQRWRSAATLMRTLQWTAAGGIFSVATVSWGPWSTSFVGTAIFIWAAHCGCADSHSSRAVRWWSVLMALTAIALPVEVGAAILSSVWLAAVAVGIGLVRLVVLALALAASTAEHDMPITRSWRRLVVALVPASLLTLVAWSTAWLVGEPISEPPISGYTRIGSVPMELPRWAETFALGAAIPVGILMIIGVVQFIRTYSYANTCAAQNEVDRTARVAKLRAASDAAK